MRAKFDISLEKHSHISPKSQKRFPYLAIAINPNNNEENIVLVTPYSVIFIGADGRCTYSDTKWFNEQYQILKLPPELTLTFRNEE